MSIRITSGWLARASSMPEFPSRALSSRMSGRRAISCSIKLQIRRIVLHIKQRAQRRARPNRRRDRSPSAVVSDCQLRLARRIQLEPEHASRADRALHADHAAHQLHQPLAHHQPDAGAFFRAPLLSQTVERLKQLQQHVRRQARARVPHADAHSRPAPAVAHSTTTVPFAWLYLIAFERRLISTCFSRVRSASTKHGHVEPRETSS